MVLKIREIIFIKSLAHGSLANLANVIIIVIVITITIIAIIITNAVANGITSDPVCGGFLKQLLFPLSHPPWILTLMKPLVLHKPTGAQLSPAELHQ